MLVGFLTGCLKSAKTNKQEPPPKKKKTWSVLSEALSVPTAPASHDERNPPH